MAVGSSDNMDNTLKTDFGIDFEGIWWMSDNPVPEELVSFAGTTITSTGGGFPVTLHVPNSGKGAWSWLMTTVGDILRRYYATGDPGAATDFVFSSETRGLITTGLTGVPIVWVDEFPFYKYTLDCDTTSGDPDDSAQKKRFLCDPTDCADNIPGTTCQQLIRDYPDDMWSRPTVFQDRSFFDDTTYTLKRVVMGDGSPHPVFWDEFMRHMHETEEVCTWAWNWGYWRTCNQVQVNGGRGKKRMQSYNSDDWCHRQHAAVGDVWCTPPT